MVACEATGIYQTQDSQNDKGEWHAKVIDRLAKRQSLTVHEEQDLRQAGTNEVYGKKGSRRDKGEEVAVVALSHAIVQPNAVMIVTFHAIVTQPTVVSTWRPPDVAGPAMFDRHFHGSCGSFSRLDKCPIIRGRSQTKRIVLFSHRRELMQMPRENL